MISKRRPFTASLPSRKLKSLNVHASSARLQQVQNLLKESKRDALLLIQGIDGRYNEGSKECMNYLLFDLPDLESKNHELDEAEDYIDDVIILVKQTQVHVYCNPMNFELLMPYIAAWPNLVSHCMERTMWDEEGDDAEEFKIKCFVSMVSDCNHVAVPYFSYTNRSVKFDKMKVEHWPLIQAYALEGYGSGTFFTLKHDVTDISQQLNALYESFDGFKTENYITEHMNLFSKQWENVDKQLQIMIKQLKLSEITDIQIAEPLSTFYNHGHTISTSEVKGDDIWRSPFVLIGGNTADLSGSAQSRSISESGKTATHMVCHGVSAREGLMCSRSYFFGTSSLPTASPSDSEVTNKNIEILSRVYQAIVEASQKAIRNLAECPPIDKVLASIKSGASESLQKAVDVRGMKFHCQLRYVSPRLSNEPVTNQIIAGKLLSLIVTVTQIVGENGLDLGGIVYSDSFLISTICVEDEERYSRSCLNLTEHIPVWLTWNLMPGQKEIQKTQRAMIEEAQDVDSKLLVNGQPVEIYSVNCWMQPHVCHLYIMENVIILDNETIGIISLPASCIKAVELYDGGNIDEPAFVTIYTTLDFQSKLPRQLYNTSRMVIVSLAPKSKAYKQFFEQVVPVWKDNAESAIKLTLQNQLSLVAESRYNEARVNGIPRESHIIFNSDFGKQPRITPQISRFLKHLHISSCMNGRSISKENLQAGLEDKEVESTDEAMLIVSIISGVPGSFKENVASFITKLTQEKSRWVIHNQTMETSHEFDKAKLESSIAYVCNMLRKKVASGNSKISRMLVVTPGYTSVQTVVNTVLNHPHKELQRFIRIGTVTTCVDPHNTFIKGRYIIPGLLEQCAAGWVNNVVMTSSQDHGHGTLNLTLVQSMIRAINPWVSFILTERGEITRSQDIELILGENTFNSIQLLQNRIFSAASNVYRLPETLQLKISKPLIKAKLISQLRSLTALITDYPFHGAVLYVSGRVRLEGSEEMNDLSYTVVSGALKITPTSSTQNNTSFMSFSGIKIDNGMIKELLLLCAKQKPSKRDLLTAMTLNRKTKDEIQMQVRNEPLPAGWFYNGTQYVDMMGDRSNQHPALDEAIQQYIQEENLRLAAYNIEIDALEDIDLFA